VARYEASHDLLLTNLPRILVTLIISPSTEALQLELQRVQI